MGNKSLENLAGTGQLKSEPFSQTEFDGLINSASKRLDDARRNDLSLESRFDLAYNASHSLALAALRRFGYRSENRYLVFQCLKHTIGLSNEVWRVLDQAHRKRNLAEYEGDFDIDEQLSKAVIRAASEIEAKLNSLQT